MLSSNYLAVASGHVDALIDYVLDVKPYHVKLSQIVEEYLFDESIVAKTAEAYRVLAFLGADLAPETSPLGGRQRAVSWQTKKVSNGVTRTYRLPLVSHPKFLSHLGQETFEVGVNDDLQIRGLQLGTPQSPYAAAFSQRRLDGPGITRVFRDGVHLEEGYDFVISHGVFSFETYANARWKQSNLVPDGTNVNDKLYAYGESPGDLAYNDVLTSYGSIRNIVGDPNKPFYEEWTLVCTSATFPPQLSVTGSHSGFVGTATFGTTFTYSSPNTYIEFDFVEVDGDAPLAAPPIALNDSFTLTPRNKITVHVSAGQETWSLIKVNPMCLGSPVSFTPVVSNAPSMQVHSRDLHVTPESYWRLTFIDGETYTLDAFTYDHTTSSIGLPLAGYPKTVSLLDGCSYKDDLIHFTIIPTTRGFQALDQFYFTVKADKPTFLVFGSTSGFLPASPSSPTGSRAEVGKWFFNGKVGFKVPQLYCWPVAFSPTIATSIDGSTWDVAVGGDQILSEVTYVGGVGGFLATGDNNVVASSLDGLSWEADVVGLAQDGQRAVVIGENGFIAMTTIAAGPPPVTYDWYQRNSHTLEDLNAITFIDGFFLSPPPTIVGLFVVVGDNGTVVTSANGDAWAAQTTGTSNNLNDVTWKGSPSNIIIVVGDAGTILTSSDAITWTPQISGTLVNLHSIIYAEDLDLFVVTGDNGTILTSPDGVTWTNVGLATTDNMLDVAYQPITLPTLPLGKLVAIGQNGAIAVSIDGGVNWAISLASPFRSIAFGNGTFVAVGGGIIPVNAQFQQLSTVHPMMEPSVYTITFVDGQRATVVNNRYGYRRGLVVNQSWSDEFVSFLLNDTPNSFSRGDVVRVYVAPSVTYVGQGGYNAQPYEVGAYDSLVATFRAPDYFGQSFPLFHSRGTVIVGEFDQTNNNRLNGGEQLIIDKALFDVVRLQLPDLSRATAPLLSQNDGWVPLEFRYVDRVDVNDDPSSTAEFSDLATRIDAYLASDPSYLVFTLRQPRYRCTNQSGSCELTFSEDFLADYLPVGANFTVQVRPEQSYGQKIGVKVTEDVRIIARFRIFLFDGPLYTGDSRTSRGPFEPPIVLGSYTKQFSQASFNAFPANPELWYPLVLVTTPHPFPFRLNLTEAGLGNVEGYDVFEYDLVPYDGGIYALDRSALGIVAFSTDPSDRPWLRFIDPALNFLDLDGVPPDSLIYNVGTFPLVDAWHQPGTFAQNGQYRSLDFTAGPALNNFPLAVADDFLVVQVAVNGVVKVPGTDYTVDQVTKTLTFTVPLVSGNQVKVGVVENGPSVNVFQVAAVADLELFSVVANEVNFTLATAMPYTVTAVTLNGLPVAFTVNYLTGVVTISATTSPGDQVEVTLYQFE